MVKYDLTKPIEIAKDVYWIGYVVPNDPFQCHVYLIKNGSESILIDPGSKIVLPIVLEKLLSLVQLKDIKYIVFHHQDPDITGSFEVLEQLFPPGERYIVTHWRSMTLLKHYNWKTPFWLVDENGWQLVAGDRKLEFVFTPYAHFPGAFVTYDTKTGVLFSSDIFGAISDTFMLFAEDTEEYYEGVELFHKHYMPSNVVLNYALDKIESKNPNIIAPQHGSIIPKDMIDKVIHRLRRLDCGLYLIDSEFVDLYALAKLDAVLQDIINAAMLSYVFDSFIGEVYKAIKRVIPSIKYILAEGIVREDIRRFWKVDSFGVHSDVFDSIPADLFENSSVSENDLYVNEEKVGKIYIIGEDFTQSDKRFIKVLMKHIQYPLAVNLERELQRLRLELERDFYEEKSLIDPLTELYNRNYIEKVEKLFEEKGDVPITILFIDIDHFKRINDTYGHDTGDILLKEVASIIRSMVRKEDIVIRYGGDEFVVILIGTVLEEGYKKAELIRRKIQEHIGDLGKGKNVHVTVSVGVAERRPGETFCEVVARGDRGMYKAKRMGRNQVVSCM